MWLLRRHRLLLPLPPSSPRPQCPPTDPPPPQKKTQELKRLDAAGQAEGGAKPRVFKLIGPALVAQDAEEARATVARRLAAIGAELERVSASVSALEGKAADKQRSLMATQQRMMAAQQQQQQQAGAGAGGGQTPAAAT